MRTNSEKTGFSTRSESVRRRYRWRWRGWQNRRAADNPDTRSTEANRRPAGAAARREEQHQKHPGVAEPAVRVHKGHKPDEPGI